MSNIYFTSDNHFGHAKVIEYCNRPFKSVDEMNEALIKNWNKVVKPDDFVFVVGDFMMYMKKPELKILLARLNGKKTLVKGNHDSFSETEWLSIGFSSVCRSMTFKIANEIVNISHYPYKKPWYNEMFYKYAYKLFPKSFYRPRVFADQLKDDGRFLLHGHTHSDKITNGRMIHVGVDAHNFRPIPLQKIADIITSIKREENGN